MIILILLLSFVFGQDCSSNSAETCSDSQVKTFLKLSASDQDTMWTDDRRDLLSGLLNYAVKNQDVNGEFGDHEVTWDRTKETCRRSFCLNLGEGADQKSVDMIRSAIYYHKDHIYGGIKFTENELVFDGVPETYVLDAESDGLDTWMIPYLVVFGLVILGITYSLYAAITETSVEPEKPEESYRADGNSPQLSHGGSIDEKSVDSTNL